VTKEWSEKERQIYNSSKVNTLLCSWSEEEKCLVIPLSSRIFNLNHTPQIWNCVLFFMWHILYAFFIPLFVTLNPTALVWGQFNNMPGYKNTYNTQHITNQHITTTYKNNNMQHLYCRTMYVATLVIQSNSCTYSAWVGLCNKHATYLQFKQ